MLQILHNCSKIKYDEGNFASDSLLGDSYNNQCHFVSAKTQLKGCKHMHSHSYNSLKKDLEKEGLPYFEGRHILHFMPKIKVHGHRKQSEIVVYPITQLLNHS